MLKKMLLAASAIGLVAVPTVASANPYYNSYTGVPHSRSYGSVYVGGGYGAYGNPYGSYYGNSYGAYGNPYGSYYGNSYGGYYGNSYNYRHRHHRNNTATGALVGGLIGAVIGGAIANGSHY